jgi:plastocyanin
VNGCDAMTATDKRGEATVQITFPGLAYDPPCLRVMEGTIVTFSGDFTTHPLVGGKVAGAMATPDATSPVPMTSSGMSAMATFMKAGDYGYYCSTHFASNMAGAVYVDAPRPPTSR